jgi:hypothetical protein
MIERMNPKRGAAALLPHLMTGRPPRRNLAGMASGQAGFVTY